MNAKQRRVWRRAINRYVTVALGWSDGVPRIAPRFRDSAEFWRRVGMCENAARGQDFCDDDGGDDYHDDDWWEDEDEQDEDGDPLGCWAGERFTPGLCPDDLCHGANRCMAKARPWEER